MSIPSETRREAYEESRKEAPTRCKQIYRRLCEDGPMTADTLMAAMGLMNPNSVRPRLSELAEWSMIRAIGKEKNRYGRPVPCIEIQDTKKTAPGGNDTEGGKDEQLQPHYGVQERICQ